MSKNVAMFVDVANIYYAARGQDVDVDYVALLKHATKGRDLIRAYAYSGLDPENENQRKFIDFLGKNDYKVLTKDIRKFGDGRVKANLDIELVVDLFRLADRMDIAVIVSGDGDFAPAIRALQDKGVRCEVISFRPNTSSDLIAVADEFIDIMKIAGIGRKKDGDKGMAMPEMPAKEVVPEFGFREASPSVAAAALAALKGGPTTTRSAPAARGRGRSRGATRAAPSEEAAPVAEVAMAEEAPRRRRRRRGGRGRSRGRDTAATAAVVGPAQDDADELAELDGLGEEREYTFSEADPETLRELGLHDGAGEVSAGEEASDARPATKPRARRTSRTQAVADAEPVEEATAKRPRTRRTRAAPAEATAGSAEAEPRPRRARRSPSSGAGASGSGTRTSRARPGTRTSRSKSDDAESGDAGGAESPADEPQGIWGRFRSGRPSRES